MADFHKVSLPLLPIGVRILGMYLCCAQRLHAAVGPARGKECTRLAFLRSPSSSLVAPAALASPPLAAEGARVIVTGSRASSLAAAREALSADTLFLLDEAGSPEAGEALVAALHGAFLNAGFGHFDALDAVTAAEFDAEFAVNVRGPLLQARALAALLEPGSATVVNTSVLQSLDMAGTSIYSATKGALRPIVRVLAAELAARGLRVNAVSPGPITTGCFARTGMPMEAIARLGKAVIGRVPLGRFGTAEEVAAVATFLLSSDASFVNGSEYVVDAGIALA